MSGNYSKSEKAALWKGMAISLAVAVVVIACIAFAPGIKSAYNNWRHDVQVADDNTNYETLKEVENTCRAYIASYEADKITYETNKNLDSEEAKALASSAKTRANRTAATYNTYYLQNNYVWKNNIPADIKAELPYIED